MFKRIKSATDKALSTKGLYQGRSTLRQQDYLIILGVSRDISSTWTKSRACKEISKRLAKKNEQ